MIRLVHVATVPQTVTSFLSGQLSWLGQRGFEITVVTSPGQQLPAFIRHENVSCHTLPMKRAISPVHDLGALARLVWVFRQVKPHIVHAHTPKAGLLAMIAAGSCRIPVRIYQLHGLRYESVTGWRRRLLYAAEKTACQLATDLLCVSQSLRQKAIDDRLIASGEATVLANGSVNGLDANRFNPDREVSLHRDATRRRLGIPSDAVVLGFVGRMVRDKGISEMVRAWRVLREEFPRLHLLLVGPFETGDALPRSLQAELRLDPRVHLPGLDWLTIPYYAAMDIFALPSHREGLGNVLLEAAAMQLPTIATRVTGCVDAVVDGQTGLLVDREDVAQFAAAIRRYLLDPQLRHAHGVAGRARIVRDFQPLSIWKSLFAHYHQLLDRIEIRESTVRSGSRTLVRASRRQL